MFVFYIYEKFIYYDLRRKNKYSLWNFVVKRNENVFRKKKKIELYFL